MQPPNKGTRPLQSGAKTSNFDAFVPSQGPGNPMHATRPLRISADAVPARIDEVRKELETIHHLVDLFRPFVNILRLAEIRLLPPEEEVEIVSAQQELEEFLETTTEPSGSPETAEPSALPEIQPRLSERELLVESLGLSPEQHEFAGRVAERIGGVPRLRQRVQVTIHQYADAESSYLETAETLNSALNCPPEAAWTILEQIGVERLKGKGYALCGFYDNFKDDPVLCRVFPPPRFNTAPKPRLDNPEPPRAPEPEAKANPLIDNLKNISENLNMKSITDNLSLKSITGNLNLKGLFGKK